VTSAALDRAEISDIHARIVRLPMGVSTTFGGNTLDSLQAVIVRIRDTDGVPGYSLLWGITTRQAEIMLAAVRYFAPVVKDASLARSGAVSSAMDANTAFFGPGVLNFGAAAYRMALTDLRCRRLQTSFSALHGRVRDRLPVYVTGFFSTDGIDEIVDEAMALYERGFHAFKMQAGALTVAEDVARITAMRERLPDEVSLMADATQHWSLPQALDACERLADVGLTWLEDPVDFQDKAAYRVLSERSPVPIANGESEVRARDLVELGAMDLPYVIIDLERIGGIEEWLTAASMLRDTACVVLPHLYPHISMQLVSTLHQPVVWVEYTGWFDQIMDYEVEVADGFVRVPDVIGSGFSPSEDRVDALATTPWEPLK
jgi:L-alanine-DL-glutamate epimerase-like enolase superfamily enzyme